GYKSEDILHIIRDCTTTKSGNRLFRKNHNLFIFQGRSWTSSEIIKVLTSWATQFSLVLRDKSIGCHEFPYGDQLRGDYFILNTNGAIILDSGSATVEGVLRDEKEDWVVKVIHESDLCTSTSALMRRIHYILSQECRWILRYIPKEHNQGVDCLAKLAFVKKEDLYLFEFPPKEALDFLKADKDR
ncbi:hypothetical protein Goari_006501, partial [Gossypium aridum]|nr:hypothetical protein [Gossypium aridum]